MEIPLDTGAARPPGGRPVWIPWIPLPRAAAREAYRLAGRLDALCGRWRWVGFAILIGILPLLFSWFSGVGGHQAASAALLTLLAIGLVRRDAWRRGVLAIALAFAAHSAVAIALTRLDPQRTARVLPGGEAYWHKQLHWIRTGQDPEYLLANWVPAHLQLVGGALIYSYLSFGGLTFYQGFYEVDLMNYYNGQLMLASTNQPLALVLGWHLWSVLRGLGFLFITYEVLSWSFRRMAGMPPTPWRLRWRGWALGLGLILADGLTKYLLTEPVRTRLAAVLR